MGIDTRHPDYLEAEDDWRVMRDTFAGERKVKEAGTLYLPMTSGQLEDGAATNTRSDGYLAYEAYRRRARFPEVVRDAVNILVGVMHREEPSIQLPERMQPLLERANRRGETLVQVLRRINEQQLLYSRHGLLADVAEDSDTPHLVSYAAESIINWDDERPDEFARDQLTFLVLNETVAVRGRDGADIFDWQDERRFRVLTLEPPIDDLTGDVVEGPPVYQTFVERDDERSPVVTPSFQGRTLDEIPWVFIGANDMDPRPDEIPLLGLARLALTIYRGEADYRQALFLLAQDTLVTIGEDESDEGEGTGKKTRVGAGAKIAVPMGGDAKYIGIESRGVPEMRAALNNDYTQAREMGSRLLEPRGSQAESGEALRIRVAAVTSSLSQVAKTGAAGLERILKVIAKWMGEDPESVSVSPNLDFADTREEPSAPKELMEARALGAPLSLRSVHRWLLENDFTRMTFEEEMAELESEPAEDTETETETETEPPTEDVPAEA